VLASIACGLLFPCVLFSIMVFRLTFRLWGPSQWYDRPLNILNGVLYLVGPVLAAIGWGRLSSPRPALELPDGRAIQFRRSPSMRRVRQLSIGFAVMSGLGVTCIIVGVADFRVGSYLLVILAFLTALVWLSRCRFAAVGMRELSLASGFPRAAAAWRVARTASAVGMACWSLAALIDLLNVATFDSNQDPMYGNILWWFHIGLLGMVAVLSVLNMTALGLLAAGLTRLRRQARSFASPLFEPSETPEVTPASPATP
jgi:hypothetical protein